MGRFFALFLLMFLCLAGFWLGSRDQRAKQMLRRFGKGILIAGGIGVAFLAIRTLPWLAALLPLFIPALIRRYTHSLGPTTRAPPFSQPFGQQGSARDAPSVSRVTTQFLQMELNHESGEMAGNVLHGQFSGSALADLDRAQLLALWQECHADPQSLAVLDSYLQRLYPDWHADAADTGGTQSHGQSGDHVTERQEALAILGLSQDAGREEIRVAHRRLIQRLHPDQGGSDYLASRINWAKDVLLNDFN